jgi:hypothetical protein
MAHVQLPDVIVIVDYGTQKFAHRMKGLGIGRAWILVQRLRGARKVNAYGRRKEYVSSDDYFAASPSDRYFVVHVHCADAEAFEHARGLIRNAKHPKLKGGPAYGRKPRRVRPPRRDVRQQHPRLAHAPVRSR